MREWESNGNHWYIWHYKSNSCTQIQIITISKSARVYWSVVNVTSQLLSVLSKTCLNIQDLFEYYVTSLKYYVIIGNGQVWMFELLSCHCLVCMKILFMFVSLYRNYSNTSYMSNHSKCSLWMFMYEWPSYST